MNPIDLVRQFHDAFGVTTPDHPTITNRNIIELRMMLLEEEGIEEFGKAANAKDRVGVLDSLCDAQYILSGTVLALGYAGVFDAAFREVHRANMSKLGADGRPVRRQDGKILKGPNYTPPDLFKILMNHEKLR
jgi:predicted HAD superfamily Cof-like phosphohydrolase